METRSDKTVDNGIAIRICKYIGMIGLIGSWFLTASGHFPYNLGFEFVGALAWLYVGIKWKDFNVCYLHLYLVIATAIAAHTQGLY